MSESTGRKLPLSLARRFICDLMHASRGVPSIGVERCMELAPLAAARRAACPRPGWCAIFAKGYACVAAARPELRRAYIPFPWPHLYEHPDNLATVVVERRLEDEDAIFFIHLRAPERQALPDLDAALRRYKEDSISGIRTFQRFRRFNRWPRLVRRLLWGMMGLSGRRRARVLGTFGVSAVGHLGAATLNLHSPLTTNLTYGPVADDGSVMMRVMFDHRALDAATVARALEHMERVLNGQIVTELGYLRSADQPPLAA